MAASGAPVVSVDIPSGWQVDEEAADPGRLQPDMLVSLTAPKQCARGFQGKEPSTIWLLHHRYILNVSTDQPTA